MLQEAELYTVIFKRISTVKGYHVDVCPPSIKYVLIFKILALIALNIFEKFVKVLDKFVPDTVNVNVYCVL